MYAKCYSECPHCYKEVELDIKDMVEGGYPQPERCQKCGNRFWYEVIKDPIVITSRNFRKG